MTTPAAQTETESRVADLTLAELVALLRKTVAEVVEELIDPDEGLELSEWAQERLDRASADRAGGRLKTVPLEEAAGHQGSPRP